MKRNSIKKLLTLMLAFVMAFTLYLPAAAEEQQPTEPVTQNTITVSVKVRTTALNEKTLTSNEKVTLPAGSTALDAIRAVYGGLHLKTTVKDGVTYYEDGMLKWHTSQWGNYLTAVKVPGHSNTNKYFGDNGTPSTWHISSGEGYKFIGNLNDLEDDLYGEGNINSTFTNKVNENGYLSEKDYNKYAGWMIIINKSTDNLGCDQVLKNNDKVDLNFTMFMGFDLGQKSWAENAQGQWVEKPAWTIYSFENNEFPIIL
ncbi:hypothetical protein SAMN05216249_12527 [Acetitomaculum ruminis DSM 5522]|uniref:DUF4430 domain-containing protein n=2 Tax=Acetitomaculum ruminis TaxID=2382 RepID=A0A1I1AIJ3_9FIRM|nr:hypothetical protein SAMN05216249_12527 [Acetitomaculum ruminis DSM 5522]